VLLLVALAAVEWGRTVGFEFTYDDHGIVSRNSFVEHFDLRSIFTRHLSAGSTIDPEPEVVDFLYRPVPLLSFAVNHLISGDRPWSYHLANVLLHALVAFAAWRLLARLGLAPPVVAVAAAFALLHPVHCEVVANVKHREEVLAALGVFGSWWCVLNAWDRRGIGRAAWAALAGASLLLGLLSKESAICALAIVPLCDVLLYPRRDRPWPHALGIYLPLLAATGAWYALRAGAVGSSATVGNEIFFMPDEGFVVRLLTSAKVWSAYYLGRGFFLLSYPISFSSRCEVILEVGWPSPSAWAGLAVAASSVGGAIVAYARGHRAVTFWIAFFWIGLFPTSNLVVPIGSVGAFRFLYLPSLAWGVLLGMLLWWLARRFLPEASRGRAILVATALLATLWTAAGIRECRAWRDEDTLNRSDLARTSNPRARYIQSTAATSATDRERWLREVVRIMEGVPGSGRGMETSLLAQTYAELAEIELERGDRPAAATLARKSLAVLTPDVRFHKYLAIPLGILERVNR
jgi:uncharacterized membrane protein (UPF0136 family)